MSSHRCSFGALVVVLLLCPVHSWAQSEASDRDAASPDAESRDSTVAPEQTGLFNVQFEQEVRFVHKLRAPVIEEVTVRALKPMSAHRQGIDDAVDEVWDSFNARNSSDEFDVTCRDELPTGSRIPRRLCRSNALRDATAEAARAMLAGGTQGFGSGRGSFAAGRAHHKRQQMGEELRGTVLVEPELAEQFEELKEREEAYDAAGERRRE